MNFEPRHELALENAIGYLSARAMLDAPGAWEDTVRDLREIYVAIVRGQILGSDERVERHSVRADLLAVTADREPTDNEIYNRAVYEPDTRDEHHWSL